MTNCRTYTNLIAAVVTGLLISVVPGITESLSAQTNQQSLSETPDPYFSKSASNKNRQDLKTVRPIRVPTTNQPVSAPNDLWTPPKINASPRTTTNPPFQPKQSTIQWEAPLTPVNRVKSVSFERKSSSIFAQPTTKIPPFQPIKLPQSSRSIIRERESSPGPNDFSSRTSGGNTFGGPAASKFGTAPASTPRQNPGFPIAPQPKNNQPNISLGQFDSSNSMAQPSNDSPNTLNVVQTPFESKLNPQPKQTDLNPVSIKQPGSSSTSVAASQPESSTAFQPGKVLALVGGQPIFVGDLMFEINQVIEKFISGAPEHIKEKRRQEMIPQVLPKFVEAKILFLGALRMLPDGVDMDKVFKQAHDEFDDKQVDKMLKASGLKSNAEFDAYLRAQGSSLRQLRQSWSQEQLTKYFLGQQLNIESEVTHLEMLDSYRENIETYKVPAKCRWEQIMIRFDRSSSRAEGKAKIDELLKEIIYGANMAAVAKKNSHGYMAFEGGQHDWTTKGALVLKSVDEAIFSLPVGKLSDVIESENGYHVIRVIERNDATKKPFLEAQVEIKERILNENRKKAFEKHVKKLKREIPVEYFLNGIVSTNSTPAS
ncbi:MAG: parvulin-like peptidyl-prolyl isomerase [Mariniblastus sp.]|jgi:parvulin-like peptidyl-prolyl isomerase